MIIGGSIWTSRKHIAALRSSLQNERQQRMLAALQRVPFHTLKIDRAFINEMLVRDNVRAIVQMADSLGMRTVSEGVESTEQLHAVQQAGCHEIQGYLA